VAQTDPGSIHGKLAVDFPHSSTTQVQAIMHIKFLLVKAEYIHRIYVKASRQRVPEVTFCLDRHHTFTLKVRAQEK
jgi:hypothetical protein